MRIPGEQKYLTEKPGRALTHMELRRRHPCKSCMRQLAKYVKISFHSSLSVRNRHVVVGRIQRREEQRQNKYKHEHVLTHNGISQQSNSLCLKRPQYPNTQADAFDSTVVVTTDSLAAVVIGTDLHAAATLIA